MRAIQALGATAVMLAPVAAHAPGLGLLGRAPVSYFAPDGRLAVERAPGAAARELKTLVRRLHEAGLEVLLQVGVGPHICRRSTAWAAAPCTAYFPFSGA